VAEGHRVVADDPGGLAPAAAGDGLDPAALADEDQVVLDQDPALAAALDIDAPPGAVEHDVVQDPERSPADRLDRRIRPAHLPVQRLEAPAAVLDVALQALAGSGLAVAVVVVRASAVDDEAVDGDIGQFPVGRFRVEHRAGLALLVGRSGDDGGKAERVPDREVGLPSALEGHTGDGDARQQA